MSSRIDMFSTEQRTPVYSLAVRKMPKSGKPEELLEYEAISAKAITSMVKKLAAQRKRGK